MCDIRILSTDVATIKHSALVSGCSSSHLARHLFECLKQLSTDHGHLIDDQDLRNTITITSPSRTLHSTINPTRC